MLYALRNIEVTFFFKRNTITLSTECRNTLNKLPTYRTTSSFTGHVVIAFLVGAGNRVPEFGNNRSVHVEEMFADVRVGDQCVPQLAELRPER